MRKGHLGKFAGICLFLAGCAPAPEIAAIDLRHEGEQRFDAKSVAIYDNKNKLVVYEEVDGKERMLDPLNPGDYRIEVSNGAGETRQYKITKEMFK